MKTQVVILILCFFVPAVTLAEDIGLPDVNAKSNKVVNLLEDGLDDWQAEDGQSISNWKELGGVLANAKLGSHLITKKKYQDFDLSLEFSLPKGGNSGVYLRGRYEVQLNDDKPKTGLKNCTGAIYGKIPVETRMYKGANSWNKLDVRLKDNTVTVLINRKPVIRSQQLKGPTRGAINQSESGPGPILLQSLNGVRFRNVLVKEL